MHSHFLITAHVVLCAYQWFAQDVVVVGGWGGGAGFDMRFSANISSQSCFVINFQR